MNHDPTSWARLGRAIRSDRERQSLGRKELAELVIERGGKVTARSIASLEYGTVPKKGVKPPSLEPTVAALGWRRGWADRILGGEEPETVLVGHLAGEVPEVSPRQFVLEMLPAVYEFSRAAVAAGADARLRDTFDELAQRMVQGIPAAPAASGKSAYGLAAYRPHAMGEGIPEDDARRINDAMESGD